MKGFVLTNNKGQALVEFILIFPIIVLILCIIIDFSNVFVSENKLENKLDDVIYLIRNNKENDIDLARNLALQAGFKTGDHIIVVAGYPIGSGNTNMMRIAQI